MRKGIKTMLLLSVLCFTTFSSISKAEKFEPRKIESVKDLNQQGKGRKKVFINVLVPIIEEVHTEMKIERQRVEEIAQTGITTSEEQAFVNAMFVKYKVQNKSIDDLLNKIVLVPTSLVLAQASLESGWGTSSVAKGANNLFGMKSFSKDGTAYKATSGTYKKYETISDSVRDYMFTLARHNAYKSLRKAIGEGEDSLELIKHLNNYSELREEYGRKLGVIIRVNKLMEHDA